MLRIDSIVDELVRVYAAGTILLYGSRAEGTGNANSDYDVAAFAAVPATIRDARQIGGEFVDIFIHPEAMLDHPAAGLLLLRGSRILRQRADEALRFLARLDEIHQRGPEPLPRDEIQARVVWARKMALRMKAGDVEGDFRRVWLLTALLEDYFVIRRTWYEGPKKALRWLLVNDMATYRAFEAALKPGATDASIDALAAQVTGGIDVS